MYVVFMAVAYVTERHDPCEPDSTEHKQRILDQILPVFLTKPPTNEHIRRRTSSRLVSNRTAISTRVSPQPASYCYTMTCGDASQPDTSLIDLSVHQLQAFCLTVS